MKIYKLFIIISFIVFLINLFVFFSMYNYVLQANDLKSYFMLYLSLSISIISLPFSYYGYHNYRSDKIIEKVIIKTIFWVHLVLVGILLVIIYQGFKGGF